jgi:hypothetical protein
VRLLSKASQLPFGENAATESTPGAVVSLSGAPPVAATT